MTRANQRYRASHGVPKPKPAAPPAPKPTAPCSVCGTFHEGDVSVAERLAETGQLQWRDDGDAFGTFRGDLTKIPRRIAFLIHPEMSNLSRGWHRVYFARIPGSRRRELRLYRVGENKRDPAPLLARLAAAFNVVFQPDGFISTQ